MSDKSGSTSQELLADFLRRRRDALSPQLVGQPTHHRRRTPGLRRDEVAHLANMSTIYYARLERGCAPQPSPAIVAGLVRALRLDATERAYLYLLAGHAVPPATDTGDRVDSHLMSVMRAMEGTSPAFVTDELGTVVIQNDLHVALFGDVAGLPGWEGNMFWCWFGSGRCRRIVLNPPDQQETIGRIYVAYLRFILTQRGYDMAGSALVADLREVSAEFSQMWDEHQVSRNSPPVVSVMNDHVGRLEFEHALVTSPQSRQCLSSLNAAAGTSTQQRLASLTERVRPTQRATVYR
jgi:hypothetical protein